EQLRAIRLQLLLEFVDLDLFQRFDDEQAVDEKTVTLGRRHPAGGGMGARDEAHVLEIGHDVANRRRRQLEPGLPRKHARTYRLSVGDVALDQCLEQVLGTWIQHEAYCTAGLRSGAPARHVPGLVAPWALCFNRGHGAPGTAFRDRRRGRAPGEPRHHRAAAATCSVPRGTWP